jgi:hypothetical protein
MQIWRDARETRRFFEEAVRDEPPRSEDVRKWDAVEGVGGDDPGDALRHLCMGYKEVESRMPKSYWVNERIEKSSAPMSRQWATRSPTPRAS